MTDNPARTIVAALAVTQTVGYGALHYSFAVLLTPLAEDLHTSVTAVTGAFTAATLAGAVAAVPVGRWLDRHGGRALMTAGSVAGAVLLATLSAVDSLPALYVVWTGIGFAAAMSCYEAAFAVLVAWHPQPRRLSNALLAVTVVAGFASSVFLPLTGALVDRYGWRIAALVLAALHGGLTIPLHAIVLRRPARPPRRDWVDRDLEAAQARRTAVHTALRDPAFWLLAGAFLAHAAAVSALGVHLVAYLIAAGHPATFAATTAGLLGLLSVTGRLAVTGAQRRVAPTTAVAAVFALQAVAVAGLALAGRTAAGAVTAVVGFGLGFGVATIARPAMLAARYDTSGYATITGILTVPLTIAKATAPLGAAAALTTTGSYTPMLAATAAACLVAAAGIAGSRSRIGRKSGTPIDGEARECDHGPRDPDSRKGRMSYRHAPGGRRDRGRRAHRLR